MQETHRDEQKYDRGIMVSTDAKNAERQARTRQGELVLPLHRTVRQQRVCTMHEQLDTRIHMHGVCG